ncbi:hypothetical protein Nstercoris_01708 [Nitrosomonas stercoris]|uniref:Transmembrane protein n=1 Tax=Nitrosomonas stercoris TaxID=1444684 RepID=A0A4Y1YMQ1_9PROT|nr:hypothetical protein Nstercoris_01708 [Nitrosomonas stercoris]
MEARYVRGIQGLQWILSGFYFFRLSPLNWIFLCFTYLLIITTLGLVPYLGGLAGVLTVPVFIAGIMAACRQLDLNNKLELEYLFYGFKKHTKALVTIGGIYLIGDVLITGFFMLMGGDALFDMLLRGKRFDGVEFELPSVTNDILSAILYSLLLTIPLLMAVWFSPMLVIFEKMPPLIAIRKSFFACLKNLFAFQIYFIALFVLAILAAIPYGLGYIIWFPVAFASAYFSYKDIFHYEQEDEDIQDSQEEEAIQEDVKQLEDNKPE